MHRRPNEGAWKIKLRPACIATQLEGGREWN
jgi:hypothetical protein